MELFDKDPGRDNYQNQDDDRTDIGLNDTARLEMALYAALLTTLPG
jgi:hypothetical protein